MKRILVLAAFVCRAAVAGHAAPQPARETTPFDRDWRFLKAEPPGPKRLVFHDASLRSLTVPHDWPIEGPFDSKNPTGGSLLVPAVGGGLGPANTSRSPAPMPGGASSSNLTR